MSPLGYPWLYAGLLLFAYTFLNVHAIQSLFDSGEKLPLPGHALSTGTTASTPFGGASPGVGEEPRMTVLTFGEIIQGGTQVVVKGALGEGERGV